MSRSRRSNDRLHSRVPFGLGHTKPGHFREMLRVAWENRDNLRYAWRVLTRGVCDGCALGTSGLSDWTIDGTHLCLVRLNLLRLNTMGPLDPARLSDVEALSRDAPDSRALRALGRLPVPLRRRRGERGFTPVRWDEAFADIGARWRACAPERTAMYLTSRGITNEVYFVAQKVMRFLGSPNVDNSARLCHSPSSVGLKDTLGVAASTCSYRDWFEADVIVFLGSNPANDQPVSTKYLLEARRRGARVLLVNAYREPGMQRYWIPSDTRSALFGSELTDRTFLVRVGGDLAFLLAAQKILVERGAYDRAFIERSTEGFEEHAARLAEFDLEELCRLAGVGRADVEGFAEELARAERGVLVWSMGITQHAHGSDNVRAICDLGLLRGWVGRDGCGLMPIRGHSGVQGGAEMGAYATCLPGGRPIDAQGAGELGQLWGFAVPARPGLATTEMLAAARRGELDALWCIGGNFLETLPDPPAVREALGKVGLRVHTDLVVTTQMLVEPADTCYLLPARTRYEQEGGGTETTTERRVIFSPEIPGHRIGEARSEWRLLLDLARAVRPEDFHLVDYPDAAAIRADIERTIPAYRGIASLSKKGDQFQWGGRHLCAGGVFPTPSGKARFVTPQPPRPKPLGEREFLLATRRGKQFNSMVQAERDPLTGAERDHVLVCAADAARLGLADGARVRLVSPHGSLEGRLLVADLAPGTLQAHWPEANVLLSPQRTDEGGVPDYNVRVTLEVPADAARAAGR